MYIKYFKQLLFVIVFLPLGPTFTMLRRVWPSSTRLSIDCGRSHMKAISYVLSISIQSNFFLSLSFLVPFFEMYKTFFFWFGTHNRNCCWDPRDETVVVMWQIRDHRSEFVGAWIIEITHSSIWSALGSSDEKGWERMLIEMRECRVIYSPPPQFQWKVHLCLTLISRSQLSAVSENGMQS